MKNKGEMGMKEVWCLKDNQGCEALYVDKELVEEGNPLNEGIERVRYFISLAKNYGINIEDIKFGYINMEGALDEYGDFPVELSEVNINNIKWSTI